MPRLEQNQSAQMEQIEHKLEQVETKIKHRNRRFFSCFNCLVYFIIILLGLIAYATYALAQSGLVKVPIISANFYHPPKPARTVQPSVADPATTLTESIRKQAQPQFIAGKTEAQITLEIDESMLTKILQSQLNRDAKNYDQAQVAVINGEMELFIHKTNSDFFLSGLVAPVFKNQEISFDVSEIKIGNFRLPNWIGDLAVKKILSGAINSLQTSVKDYGHLTDISLAEGKVIVEMTVSKNSLILNGH